MVGFRRPITSQYANLVTDVLHTSALNTVQIVTSPISLPWAAYTPKGVFFEILRLGNLQAGWTVIRLLTQNRVFNEYLAARSYSFIDPENLLF